jgi:hypothetical protein
LKKLVLLGATVGMAAGALVLSHKSHAADHLDSPSVQMPANQMADIGDVYSWMSSDGAKVNFAMTVSPADMGTNAFGPSVQYVWHVTTHPGATNAAAFGKPGTETKLVCTFASNTSAKCWVVEGTTVKDYVTGDPSTAMTSADGKVKVFAGRRSDPFFFNLAGFKTAATYALTQVGGGLATIRPGDGCLELTTAQATIVQTDLATTSVAPVAPCPANQRDCFANFNVMAIVVQADKSLFLHDPDHLLSVWGSTHAAQ